MVDFKQENSHLYLPKNLSYDKGTFKRYYEDSLYLQALCDIRKDLSDFSQRVSVIEYLNSNRNSAITSSIAANRKNSSVQIIPSVSNHESSTDFLVALDLAFSCTSKSNTLYTKSNGSKWTKMEDSVILKGDLKDSKDTGCTNEIDSLSKELKSLVQRPQSPSTLSDTGTDFSEDYMRMTDIGEGSQCSDSPGGRSTPFGSTSSYDSSMSFCDRTSICTLENHSDEDLERITVNFSSNLDLTPDDDPLHAMKTMETDLAGVHHLENQENSYISSRRRGLVSKRLKEKELPKIKLLLSQSPPTAELFDKGLCDLTNDSPELDDSTPTSSGSLFTNQEFDFLETVPVKRSISLKTYKTPPGTPHRKKVVRFADAMGLDLEDVKHVMNHDDPPTIPASAMKDLQVGLEEEHKTEGTKYLTACFSQPGANPNFIQYVTDAKVKLENCMVDDQDMTVSGTVRVANIAFHKRVVLRYSVNNWLTCTDVFASYVQNSNDGATDRFSFTFGVPNYFQSGSKVQFAVMFEASGQQYWDNNGGSNYIIECYATAVPVTAGDNLWMHFL